MKTLIVIPAYNEAASIVCTVEHLRHVCPELDFIVVNDGSSDSTAQLCLKHGYPLLDLATNLGLAGAFAAGMKYALNCGYTAVIQFDADGQHRPEYIASMIAKLQDGNDIVVGSRFIDKARPKSLRMLGSGLISWAIKLVGGVSLSDPTSGFRAYGTRIMQKFATQINITPEPDTVSYLIKIGAKVADIPVTMDERHAGKSYLTAGVSIKYMLRMTVSILFVQAFRKGSL